MKKISIFLLLLFLFQNVYSQDDVTLKSLKAYVGDETEIPVLLGTGPGLTIEFDIEAEFVPAFNVVFRYCDRNWLPYENIFLLNHGQNIAYDAGDYTRLPVTVKGASYHFKDTFTGDDGFVSFPFSGKWRYYITDSQDTSFVYATGKFLVIYPEIEPGVTVKNVLLEDKTYYPLELGRAFDITASFDLPQELFPSNVMEVEIIENHNLDLPYVVDRNFNTNIRQFYWNGDRKFSFSARDVRPGNEYRQADLRDHNVYIGDNVPANIEGYDISRFHRKSGRDLNGGSVLTNFKNEYATYLNVQFRLRAPESNMGDIFLVGAFNDWQLLPEYSMDNSGGMYSKTIQLKRGIYDYQYVTADVINGVIKNENWVVLEGNFWETSNNYHVLVYYNDPDYGGYDRVIGYKKITTR